MLNSLPIARGTTIRRDGSNDWVRPGLRQDIYKDSLILLLLGLCKPGRILFRRSNLKSATWLAQAGSHFFSERPVSRVCLGGLAKSVMQISLISRKCDLACASRVALFGG